MACIYPRWLTTYPLDDPPRIPTSHSNTVTGSSQLNYMGFLIGPHQEASDVSEPAELVYLSAFVTDGLLEPTDLKKNN